jgi:hypothetical protein
VHSSMDKGGTQARPYCETHDKWFRNWTAAKTHQLTSSGRCYLVTKIYRAR